MTTDTLHPSAQSNTQNKKQRVKNINSTMTYYSKANAIKTQTRFRREGEYDVLCGRGGAVNSHSGNVYFRSLVQEHKSQYNIGANKNEKAEIAEDIIEQIKNMGGHFLQKLKRNSYWEEVPHEKALAKTSQALREGAPALRQKAAKKNGRKRPRGATEAPIEIADYRKIRGAANGRGKEIILPQVLDRPEEKSLGSSSEGNAAGLSGVTPELLPISSTTAPSASFALPAQAADYRKIRGSVSRRGKEIILPQVSDREQRPEEISLGASSEGNSARLPILTPELVPMSSTVAPTASFALPQADNEIRANIAQTKAAIRSRESTLEQLSDNEAYYPGMNIGLDPTYILPGKPSFEYMRMHSFCNGRDDSFRGDEPFQDPFQDESHLLSLSDPQSLSGESPSASAPSVSSINKMLPVNEVDSSSPRPDRGDGPDAQKYRKKDNNRTEKTIKSIRYVRY